MDIVGTRADESLNGSDQADVIRPNGGFDTVGAAAGEDVILLEGDGALAWGAVFDGGADRDTLDATAVTGSLRIVEAGLPTFGFPVTTVRNIEHVVSGAGDDVIGMLNKATDVTIVSGGGDDIVAGGLGNDTLNFGSGMDMGVYYDMYRDTAISFSGGEGSIAGPTWGTDTMTGVEYVVLKDGIFAIDQASSAAQVSRLYLGLLDRHPTAIELDKGAQGVGHGGSLAGIASQILQADGRWSTTSSLTNADFVERLYSVVLDRPSESAGKDYWITVLNSGVSRMQVALGFTESLEFKATTSPIIGKGLFVTDESSQLVASLYHAFAGRLPEQSGFDGWNLALRSGALNLQEVAARFADSAEFRGHTNGMNNIDLVRYMYNTALVREPEPGAVDYWAGWLDRGLTVGELIVGFATSDEHLQLIAPAIYGGIEIFG